MAEGIDPVRAGMRLAQLLGEDTQIAPTSAAANPPAGISSSSVNFTGNPFEDILNRAIQSLEGVTKSEVYANQMVEKYINKEAELLDVMVAQAKMNVMVQLAVTTVNSAVSSFKEITQIQV